MRAQVEVIGDYVIMSAAGWALRWRAIKQRGCLIRLHSAPGDSGKGGDGGYYSPGSKGVTDRQADWISRTHTPPAGR